MYFLMKNLPLNNVLTMLLAVIKKSLGILYSKIFTHYLQRIFDSSNRLQMSFMTNLITVLSMKNKSQDSSNLSNNTCHRRYLSRIIFPQELGLELIKFQRQFRQLCCMFNIMKNATSNYIISLIPKRDQIFKTKNKNVPTYNCRKYYFKYSFFHYTLYTLFNIDVSIRNSESIPVCKSKLLSFIRPVKSNIFKIFDPKRLKLLTHLCIDLDIIFTNV